MRDEAVHPHTLVTRAELKPFLLLGLVIGWAVPVLAGARSQQASQPHGRSVILDSRATIFIAPNEPSPVGRAAEDLAADLQKVLGTKPRIVSRAEDTAATTIVIAEQSNLPETMRPGGLTGAESFSISIAERASKAGEPGKVVLLAGADMRGTIYAIYEFSEEYLGVDPLYYWTDHEPLHRSRIVIPAAFKESFAAPVFRYRGFFINDEDLLTGWAPGEKTDGTGISLAVWDKIFETILRLKGNMVAPGTWIFPDEPQIKLAGKRGLIVTEHHAIPLGLNVARWPKDVPYNFSTHPEILERAWRNAVAAYPPGQEVLWTVGLRGLSDVSYASMDASVRGNDQALGRLIGKAIADQIRIVRSLHPEAEFTTNLWQEGARLVRQGDLAIPPEVRKVWADDGYGYLQDKGEVAEGQGAYYHVAMMNGRANQLTEMVPAERILAELGRYIKAGATHYLLVNTSDIRPVLMTIQAVMDIAWKGLASAGPDDGDQFYRRWSAEQFGSRAGPKVAEIYKEYFQAPIHFGEPEREYGDQAYHTEARRMMLTYMIDAPLYSIPSQAPKWVPPRIFAFESDNEPAKKWLYSAVENEIAQCSQAQPRWDAVWKKALEAQPLVAADRQPFYRAHALAMIAINRESNRMLYRVARAIQQAEKGRPIQARESAEDALRACDEIRKAEAGGEYGKWKNWYRGDWLTGVYRTRQTLEIFLNYLTNPLSHLPPPVLWSGWEAYYHIMYYEGDRSADVN